MGGFCLKRWYHQKYYLLWVSKNELKIFLASNWKLTAITTTFPIKNQIYFISLNKIRAHTKGATHTQKKFFLQCVSLQIFCHDKKKQTTIQLIFIMKGKAILYFTSREEKNNSVVDEKRIHLKMISGSFSSFVPFFQVMSRGFPWKNFITYCN